MTQPPAYPMVSRDNTGKSSDWLARLSRGLPPVLLLAGGWAGFVILSREAVKPKSPPATPQALRTQVQELVPRDFPVVVRAQGVVRPHNEISLSPLVAGKVARLSPAFQEGAFFESGEVLLELEADDYRTALAVAQARVLGASAALQLARLSHLRDQESLKSNLIPQAQADVSAASLSQAQAELDSAQAQAERARRDLERTSIRAPFKGCVRKRFVGLGQLVSPSVPLGTIFAIDAVEVRLPIAGRELPFLKVPQTAGDPPLDVEFRNAIGGASEHVWKGKIVRSEGALDENSLELFVVARVEDPFGRESGHPPLRVGQPVVGFIQGQVLTNVLALPRGAVRQLDRIHLVNKEKLTLRGETIQAVWSSEDHVVVRNEQIPPGFLLATTHLVYAPDGAKVEILPSPRSAVVAAAETNRVSAGGRGEPVRN
ncbi:MAG: efflux RND transporter periplasmic adaptor subunit [Verrucomicrobia bacterium]|nr:efflux RND transporter periplasmic adaptor subunit [Verrucomicrobiota bacterium]